MNATPWTTALRRLVPRATLFRWRLNLYPPYVGAGVHVVHVADDLRTIQVELRLRWWNQNYVGTAFGGSLYSFVDPFFMLILFETFHQEAVVWDKAATIRFRRPGRGTVRATITVPPERIEAIRARLQTEARFEEHFTLPILAEDGTVVAEVDKVLHLARKDR